MNNSSILPQILQILGVAIGALAVLLGTWLTRKGEDRRALRQLGIEIGRAKFDDSLAFAQKVSDATGRVIPVPSLDAHLLHGIRLAEIISDTSLNPQEIARRIAAIKDTTDAVTEAAKEQK